MEADFAPRGRLVGAPQAGAALQPQQQRQRGGDSEEVIEMASHNRSGGPAQRTQQPAIQSVAAARDGAQRIADVAETFHNSPAISRPEPSASKTRRTNEGSGGRWESIVRLT